MYNCEIVIFINFEPISFKTIVIKKSLKNKEDYNLII